MDTLQNSNSAFRELRQAAGYTQDQLVEFLTVSRGAVQHWDDGSWRPRWQSMLGLAKLFKIDLAEAVRLFWHENVGDPCPCGCGGEKVLPTRDGAKHLYISLSCEGEQCDPKTPRPPYRTMQGHRALCVSCSYAAKKVERITLTCEGYRPYPSVVIPLHARRCRVTKDFLPRQIGLFKHKSDIGEGYPFADVERGKWRNPFCASAFRLLRKSEENLKKKWTEAHPNENFPRIRSADDRKRVQRKLTDQRYFNSENPKPTRDKDLPRPRRRVAPHVIDPAVPERKRKWRREKSPPPLGLCGLCDTLTCEYHKKRLTKFHRECVREYQREHGAELAGPRNADGTFSDLTSKPVEERPRPGPPVDSEILQRHFLWTTRHKLLGDSLGDIAADTATKDHPDGFARNAVVEGIEFIMGKVAKDGKIKKSVLPLPDRMPLPIRQRIIALRSLADPRCLPDLAAQN